MKTPGAPAASLMHTLRSRRRLPLFVLLVLVLQALAPAWLASARAEPLTTVLCTAEGVRHVMVVDSGAPAQTAAQHATCPYCGAHWQPPLLASSDALRVTAPAFDAALPSAAPAAVDSQRVVAAHRSRAPPAPR